MPDFWTDEFALDPFELMTGPAKIQTPPQMGRGDRVIFPAVIHVRLFGVGEILGNPKFTRENGHHGGRGSTRAGSTPGSHGFLTARTRQALPQSTPWVEFSAAESTPA
jgi:hypothetical protein